MMNQQVGAAQSGCCRALFWFGCLLILGITSKGSYAFEPNKVYNYEFEGAITTRVADDDRPQYSGLALTTPIQVKRSASDELTVRLVKPQAATFNDVIEEIHLYKYDYKPISDQSPGLDSAFRIYLDGETGAVKSFDSHKDEPKWVTNFKRGLLSFFQLKLKSPSSDGDGSSNSISNSAGSGGSSSNGEVKLANQHQHHQYYSISEKSVFGECETDYLVMMEPISSSSSSSAQQQQQQSEQQFAINVTKTRNMARCKSRFLHKFMPIDSNECFENEKELQQYKHSNAIFQYNLLGTRQNYIIDQVLVDEMTTYSPFGQKAHSHLVHSKFMMKLMNSEAGSLAVDDSSLAKLESLSYDPPEMSNFYANINLDQEHHLSSIYQTSASVEQVMEAFEALVQENKAYTGAFEGSNEQAAKTQENSRMAELFIRLNELVGTLNIQKIEQLYAQVDERGEAYKKIFWDLMSVTGTNPSFTFMKRLITDGDAPSVKIRDFLTRLSYHIKMPSKSLFDEYVNLCKSDKIQTNQQYKRLCSLPLSSLIHQHCAKPHAKFLRLQQEGAPNATAHKRGQNTCQIATAEEYFTRLVVPIPPARPGASSSGGSSSSGSSGSSPSSSSSSASSSSTSSSAPSSSSSSSSGGSNGPTQTPSSSSSTDEMSLSDKMFQVKMAGELGVRPSIDYLMEIVANVNEHPSLRSAAMWQLHKVSRIYPQQVKRLVVPYYHDRNEMLEIRVAAFHNWLTTGLSLHEMETMSKQLISEPSRQLVIYVHSLMSSLAKLDSLPCVQSKDRHARLVLPNIKRALARHSAPTGTDSYASVSSSWQPEFGYGTASMMSVIFSNDSMAPSNFFYSSSEIMAGLKLTPMSVSIQAHGLDKLIKRVAGINGLLADKESFMDVFSLKRRSKRQVSADLIKQEIQEIDKELHLSQREFSDVYLAVTISAYGRPVTFIDRDSRELKKMLSDDGTIKIPAIKKLLHSFSNLTIQQMMVNFEKLEVFNNELGLPLYQSINDFDFKTFKLNSVKLDVEPAFFRDERQGKPPSKFGLMLDAKIGRHNEMFVSTGTIVAAKKQQVGVGFHKKKLLNVPLKMTIDASLLQNQLTIKRQPIHESLLYIRQSPVTFLRSFDPSLSSGRFLEQQALPLYSMSSSSSSSTGDNSSTSTTMKPFKLEYMTPLAVGLRLEGKHRAGQDWSMSAWRRYMNSIGLSAAKFMYFYSPTGQPLEARLSTITTQDDNPTRDLTYQFSWRHHHNHNQETKSNDLNEVEQELETATAAQGIDKGPPSTVSYKAALIGGSTKERKVQLDISYSCSFDRLLHKWRAFYTRTPLDQGSPSSEVTNLCWLGQMRFPNHPAEQLLNFQLDQLDHSANLTSELTFGDECQESKSASQNARVSARVMFEWSKEQRKAIEEALKLPSGSSELLRNNVYAQLYGKCLAKRKEHGAKLEPSCLQLLRKTGELAHISAYFDYKDVPERWTKLVRRLGGLYTYARAGYIEEMDDRATNPAADYYKSSDGTQRDRAHLEANISSLELGQAERKLSYEFDTPQYHVQYKNVPINIPPLSTFPLLGASFYQQVQSRTGMTSCLVSGQTVNTFDNYTYQMPGDIGDGCSKLIAKDCSPEANYIVLGAKVGQTGKTVKVYVGQKFKVEFVPDKDGKRISDIKVNSDSVQVEPSKPALRRDTKIGTKSMEAFQISSNGAYYTLSSKLYKFSVSTDGTWIHVQQSKYYSGKSCGLCGDANGDQVGELKSPRQQVCKNQADLVWSYVLPSTCASRPASIECA